MGFVACFRTGLYNFDVVELILPSFCAGFLCLPSDPFAFEQVKEALSERIIMAVPAPAH